MDTANILKEHPFVEITTYYNKYKITFSASTTCSIKTFIYMGDLYAYTVYVQKPN